jgi:hypothetical protein
MSSLREKLRHGCRQAAVRVLRVALRPLLRAHEEANAQARRNAESLIAACRAFEAKHGRLPETLGELVPAFLPALPAARYDGPHFGFQYEVSTASGHHVLGWTDTAPFGRPFYVFEEDRWGYLD